jgi:hypothetical protein
MSLTGTVYQHANYAGTHRSYYLSNSYRYYRVWQGTLENAGLHDAISSAQLQPSVVNDCLLICFQNRFTGRYLVLGNQKDTGVIQKVDSFVPYNMNDVTTTVLLVRTHIANELRFSARDLIQAQFIEMLDQKLKGTQASRSGNPVITWDMWPNGEYLSSDKKYIKIQQKLHISIDWWPDYDATMTYHIYLYVDNKKLKGYAARWWVSVESGVKSDDIFDALAPKVSAGMDDLNSTLQSSLQMVGSFNFTSLYLLPGKRTGRDANGVSTGNTDDDVTIVLQT